MRRRRRAANSDFIARLPYCRPDKSYFYHSRTRRRMRMRGRRVRTREREKERERERERVKRGWKCWSGREKRGGMTETALDIEGTGGGYRRHVHLHRFAWKQPFSMSRHRIYLSLDRRWFLRHFVSSFHVSIETRLSNRVSRLLSIDYHSFPCVHNSMKTEKEKVRNNNKNSNNNKYTFLENNNFLQRDKWKIIISSQS